MPIPTVLHQLWKTEDTPQRYAAFRESWPRRNPGWKMRLWTDRDLAALVEQRYPELLDLFRGYADDICRADLGRYLILESFGGVYADLDCECLKPLAPLLEGSSLVIGLEPDGHAAEPMAVARNFEKVLCPSFIASIPAHPFWRAVRSGAVASAGASGVLDRTGPFLLTSVHCRRGGADVTLAPAEWLYPFNKLQCWSGEAFALETWERATRRAFVAHYWDGSWVRNPTPLDGLPWNVSASFNAVQAPPVAYPAEAEATKVTCVTVIAGAADGLELALESFRRQTHANKALLVVSHDLDAEAAADLVRRVGRSDIALLAAPSTHDDLLALGASHAAGDVVCRWDAGELHDPRRLEVQLQVLRQTGAHACVLSRTLEWRPTDRRLAITAAAPQAASLMWRREAGHRLDHLLTQARVVSIDMPKLRLKIASPENFDAAWTGASARFEGDRCDAVVEELGKRLPVAMAHGEAPRRRSPTRLTSKSGEVVILTPIKDGRRHLPRYFELLERLDAGGAPLSLGLLEGDSRDGTFEALDRYLPGLQDRFERVVVRQRHDGLEIRGPRWAPAVQRQRRAAIARARNRLLAAALGEAEWALWLDVDVADYPPDLLVRLLGAGKDIVAAHCVYPTGRTFDLNTFIFAGEAGDNADSLHDGLYQPPRGAGRLYLEDVADQDLVRVDAVGGTALLVRGQLHRDGLNFPAYSHGGYIETEGLAMMARDLGRECWAMPGLRITHHADQGPAAWVPPAPAPEIPDASKPARAGEAAKGRHARLEAALGALDAAAQTARPAPEDDPIFVCAIGWRCGSTLLQRILMTDPKVFVWGEPLDRLGVLSRLAEIVEGAGPDWPPPDHWVGDWSKVDRTGGWIANLSPDAGDLKAALRALLDTWLAQPARREGFERWGVKEVRWTGVQARVLRWLYPSARFVVIVRNPIAAYASMRAVGLHAPGPGFWVRWPDRHVSDLDAYARYWNELALSWSPAAGPLDATVLRYEDLITGRVDLGALGARLGLALRPALALDVKAGAAPTAAPLPRAEATRVNALTAHGRAVFGIGDWA
jgi:hypothetical protein